MSKHIEAFLSAKYLAPDAEKKLLDKCQQVYEHYEDIDTIVRYMEMLMKEYNVTYRTKHIISSLTSMHGSRTMNASEKFAEDLSNNVNNPAEVQRICRKHFDLTNIKRKL
jgi:hypothetical protein